MTGSGIPYALETALGSIVEELEFYGLGKPLNGFWEGAAGCCCTGPNWLPRRMILISIAT